MGYRNRTRFIRIKTGKCANWVSPRKRVCNKAKIHFFWGLLFLHFSGWMKLFPVLRGRINTGECLLEISCQMIPSFMFRRFFSNEANVCFVFSIKEIFFWNLRCLCRNFSKYFTTTNSELHKIELCYYYDWHGFEILDNLRKIELEECKISWKRII